MCLWADLPAFVLTEGNERKLDRISLLSLLVFILLKCLAFQTLIILHKKDPDKQRETELERYRGFRGGSTRIQVVETNLFSKMSVFVGFLFID